MTVNQNIPSAVKSTGKSSAKSDAQNLSNTARAVLAWGDEMPGWVRLLASACDSSNQRIIADRLDRSGPYISRIINAKYTGDYGEAENLVRSVLGQEDVICPLWGAIPLRSCIRQRRYTGPPDNMQRRLHARHCPDCPNNTDTGA